MRGALLLPLGAQASQAPASSPFDAEKQLAAVSESAISDPNAMPPSAFVAVAPAPSAPSSSDAMAAAPLALRANTRRGAAPTSSFPPPPPSAAAQLRTVDNQTEADADALDAELDDDELDDDDADDAETTNAAAADGARPTPAAAGATTAQSTATTATAATDGKAPQMHVIRRRNVGVPKFLRFLYQILEQEDRDVISWSHKGTAFQIRQPDELAEHVLPRYFKHNKVSSFQRQLNYFGFKKWTKTQTTICTFSHPFFLRDDKDKMKLIKRKERVGPLGIACADAASLAASAAAAAAGAKGAMDATSSLCKGPRANEVVRPAGIGARELAMRRHSTGALALTAAMMQSGNVAMLMNRKRAGTVDLEFESQHGQQGLDVIKEAGPCMPSRAKRKSLPHVVLPPTLKDRKGNQVYTADFGSMDMTRPFSAAPMPIAASHGGYFAPRTALDGNLKQDALSSAVLPVSSELMMMHQHPYHRQHSHPGTMSSSGHFHLSGGVKSENAIDMSDLSGPLQSVQSSTMSTPWIVPSANNFNPSLIPGCGGPKDPNMAMMNPFKFENGGSNNNSSSLHQNGGGQQSAFDPMPIMDYSNNSAQLSASAMKMHAPPQHQPQSTFFPAQQQLEPQQKDFIDMLLETAALNDQESQPTGMPVAWNQHYQQQQLHAQHHLQQQQQQQQQHQQSMAMPFGFMQQQPINHQQQQQQHQQQQMQLSSAMNGMGSGQAQRF